MATIVAAPQFRPRSPRRPVRDYSYQSHRRGFNVAASLIADSRFELGRLNERNESFVGR
jgi:hypothetical protein